MAKPPSRPFSGRGGPGKRADGPFDARGSRRAGPGRAGDKRHAERQIDLTRKRTSDAPARDPNAPRDKLSARPIAERPAGGHGRSDRGERHPGERGGFGARRDERGPAGRRDERGPAGRRDERGSAGRRNDDRALDRRDERGAFGRRDERGPAGRRDEREGNRRAFPRRADAPRGPARAEAPRQPKPEPHAYAPEVFAGGTPHAIAEGGERIAKLLARAGIASRREVERMIEQGRVAIDEQVVTTPATVLSSLKGLTVDGKPVRAPDAARLWVFHKPSGLITAERDPSGRPTIYTALRNALPAGTPRLMPVGRLDLNTEGLLLLTNDGELKRAMELPSTGVPRTYRARTFGDITQPQLEELMQGVEIDGIRYGSINANMERRTGRNQWIELTLTEGKNREVRRVLEHLGLQVSRLLRISYGPFELGDLPRGSAAPVRQQDVELFRKQLKKAAG